MEDVTTKICNKCKQEKTLDQFYKSKTNKYGVYTKCKKCLTLSEEERIIKKSYLKEYQRNNKQKIKQKRQEYYIKNRDKVLYKVKNYRDKHIDTLKEKGRVYGVI